MRKLEKKVYHKSQVMFDFHHSTWINRCESIQRSPPDLHQSREKSGRFTGNRSSAFLAFSRCSPWRTLSNASVQIGNRFSYGLSQPIPHSHSHSHFCFPFQSRAFSIPRTLIPHTVCRNSAASRDLSFLIFVLSQMNIIKYLNEYSEQYSSHSGKLKIFSLREPSILSKDSSLFQALQNWYISTCIIILQTTINR